MKLPKSLFGLGLLAAVATIPGCTHRSVSKAWAENVQFVLCAHEVSIDSIRAWPELSERAKQCQEFINKWRVEHPGQHDPEIPPPIKPGW